MTARNIVIMNHDYTVSILRLNLTWRYWLFRPTRVLEFFLPRDPDLAEENEGVTSTQNAKLASSLQLLLEGLEVFMYNRSFAYDNIVEKLEKEVPGPQKEAVRTHFESTSSSATSPKESSEAPSSESDATSKAGSNSVGFLLHMLPISVRIKKGAYVMGNSTTPTILVASFKSAIGLIDYHSAGSIFDRYRTVYDLNMEKFQVSMKPNISYDPLRYSSEAFANRGGVKTRPMLSLLRFKSVFRKLLLRRLLRKQKPDLNEEWRGLRRYIDDFQDERLMNLATIEEYAKYSVLLDSVSTQMIYYYDVPGPTTPESLQKNPPKFGVDLILSMATLHYGPWAERQRGPLHALFFPPLCRDSTPSPTREPWGCLRTYDGFDFSITVKDELIIRTPTRELSKDREELAHYTSSKGNQKITRPFGWIELKVGGTSKITSFNSYKAFEDGWPNRLNCFFSRPEMRSSVNHDVFFIADEHTIDCDFSFPLKWNGKTMWTFDNKSKNAQLFFLRDHAFLFTDLISDFGSGTPAPYEQFKAFDYIFNWDIEEYRLHFNVNDHNIINNALDLNNNKYICFHGGNLGIHSTIPLLGNFSKSTTIDFRLFTDSLNLSLEVPPWHTASSFLKGNNKMGQTDNFEVTGSYTFYRNIEINYSSYASINAIGDNITLLFFGYFIRYLFTFRENYMGDFKHFKTFEEYTHGANLGYQDDSAASLRSMASNEGSVKEKEEEGDPAYWNELKTENDLNVEFTFKARNGLILLPCNTYDHVSNVGLTFDYLDVDIHLCHFYMDLQADFSPVTGYHLTNETPGNYHGLIYNLDEYKRVGEAKGCDIIIDNFQVHTHRMLGLAPSLLTYHCKWDFSCASFIFDTHPSCLAGIKLFFVNFISGFKDLENTFIYEIPLVFDMANFTFRCDEIIVKLDTGVPDTIFKVGLDDVLIAFTDRANERYSSKICVSMPKITAEVSSPKTEYQFYLVTSLMLTDICLKAWPNDFRRNQQAWARRNDAPTHRIPYLINEETKDAVYDNAYGCLPTSVSLPHGSIPLTDDFYLVRETRGYDDDLPSVDSQGSLCGYESNDRIEPTTDYHEEDFAPQTEQEPGHKTDTFVLEFETIDGFFSPPALAAFQGLAEGFDIPDIELLLDVLQAKTVKDIKMFITPLSMCDNVRFVAPEINFRITEQPVFSPSDVLCHSPKIPVITLNIEEPSIAFTKLTTRIRETHKIRTEEPLAMAVHMKNIYCFVRDPQSFSPSASFTIEDVEAWLSKDFIEGLTSSVLFQDMKLSLVQADIPWLFSFATKMAEGFEAAKHPSLKDSTPISVQKLMYLIANVAKTSGLEHDPTVLTKPSSILRSCDEHVRFYEGWKLVTKFRSIVDRLPHEEYVRLSNSLKDPEWKVPDNARDEIATVFSTWRSWEQLEARRNNFLSQFFPDKLEEPEKPLKVHFETSKLEIEIIEPQGARDNFLIQSARVIFHKFPTPGGAPKTVVLFDMDAIDGSFSKICLETVKTLSVVIGDNLKCKDQEQESHDAASKSPAEQTTISTARASDENPLFFLFVSLKLAHIKFALPNTFFQFSTYENFNGFQKMGTSLCLASSAREYSLVFGRDEMHHLDFTFNDANLLVAHAGSLSSKIHQLDFKLENCDIKVLDCEGELLETIRLFLEEDLKLVKEQFKSESEPKTEVAKPSKPFSLSLLPDFHANFEFNHIAFDIQVLCPLLLQITILKDKTSLRHQNGTVSFLSNYQKFLFDLKMNDFPLLRVEDTHLQTSQKLTQLGDLWAIDSNLNLGYVKFTNLNVTNSLHEVLKNWTPLNERISNIKLLVPAEPKKPPSKPLPTKSDPFDKLALRLNLKQENLTISTFKEQCRYTLDFEGVSWSASNVHKSANGLVSRCLLFGDFSIPVMRISVLDPTIPVGLSNMLDLNITAKILNDNPEDEASDHTRSLQIESEHIRICLSPLVLFKIVDLADLATRVYGSYDLSLPTVPQIEAEESDGSPEPQPEAPGEKQSRLKFSSVHVLFYNFCLGWLFGSTHKDYPGLILGAERIFAVTKHELGKLSLMEGYLSAANGNTSSSFYSILSELNSLNRAFMPKMQFNYCITDDNELWVDLKGDELDVRFMSNSLVMVERTVKSGSEVQEFFQGRSRSLQRRRSYKEQIPQKPKKKSTTPFKSPFSSVQTNISFAGSRVLFYRLQEENLLDVPPSLSLQSPSVNLAVYYKHLKERKTKRHNVRFEILMKLSDNTVYSSCVPVIMDFIEASKLMLRNSKQEEPENEVSDEMPAPQCNEAGSNIGNILQDIDFHVGIIIEKQRLSLSCEPTAKVAAVVEFEGASVLAANNINDAATIDAMARLDSIGASLQHIYSDERSGFIGIKSIMVSNSITFDETVNVVSSGSISDVTAYVKMKQYQDVDLFRDIWYPKRYHNTKRQPPSKLTTKRSQSKMREVSSTYAIPFSLTYILSNVDVEVDFGVALGVVMLNVDKGWVVSRKTSDWFYDMNFGLHEMHVGSRGRLGGYVKLEKANVRSSIEWRMKELPFLDVPLVKFSGGFENFTFKLAFDQHLFAVGNLEKWRIEVYNRKNGINILKDHLYVMIQYRATEIFLTSLAASDFHDIFSTMSRMMDEKRTSYKEILNDSSKDQMHDQDHVPMNKLLEVVKKLETYIEVRTGSTAIQVYPQSFDDSRVLYIQLDKSTASFFQNEYTLGVSNEIELKFNNLTTSLSTAAGITKESIDAFSVPEFAAYARKAKGGTIFLSPKFMISMRTFQRYNSNIIEYLFQSSFGGTVDVRWNLGSVNCVREMYAAHRRAFASRTEYSTSTVGALRDKKDIENAVLGADVPDEGPEEVFDSENARKDIDRDINETFEKVAKDSKFSYVPLAPPIIEAPRLKELGNATPPLEWFGLHRDKFPDATHQLAIVTLQKLIHEIDDHYSKALGTS